ncbi:MAG: nucleoside 2-deoxyribosyltransferase domain-containing protein [Spirochaetota bacterium]|nr:nucleoside 2-deoxyribosyltransferase domain-containing protein [Spirochaetota bacterium]
MKIIKPPSKFILDSRSIFLAGSIEMGKAENWQEKVERLLKDTDWTILNPRRDDWDTSWKQTKDNKQFREQVEWELEAQEGCDKILMYFDPNTKATISLLELGLFAGTGKMIVVCPEGFYRKGNVDITCERYKVEQADTIEEALQRIIR